LSLFDDLDDATPTLAVTPPNPELLRRMALQCAWAGRDVAERAMFLDMLGLLPSVGEVAA
jgi:hypothetical protein